MQILSRNTRNKERIRSPKFKCCNKHKHNGNRNRKMHQCYSCESLFDEKCLLKYYRIYGEDIGRNWNCPDCMASEYQSELSDDTTSMSPLYTKSKKSNKYNQNKKKNKKKKSKKYKSKKIMNMDGSEEDTIDELSIDTTDSETTNDISNKKITEKIKKRMLKEKSIKNRLNSISSKHKLKYNESMLELSSSGTDEDFDAGTWYPKRMPDTDKQLENKRKKQCKKHHQTYKKIAKITRFRTHEKEGVIKVLNDIAENPVKYQYNPHYGWSSTDIAAITSKQLYEVRRKNAKEHETIPLRNIPSIKGLFKRWDETGNKESEDKDFISQYEVARNKFKTAAKKASSDVNKELLEFGEDYATTRLEHANKEIKKLKKKNDVISEIKGAVTDVRGLINELKQDSKSNVKDHKECDMDDDITPIGVCDVNNPYIDNELLEQNNDYSLENNKKFIDKYQPKANDEITGNDEINCDETVKENNYDENACDCSHFLTQMYNQPKGPFDEENNVISKNVMICERALWDDGKAHKLGIKFDSLKKVVPKLSNEKILLQLANTVQFL